MQLHFDMHAIRRRTILVLWPAILPLLAAAKLAAAREPAPTTAPEFLNFDELVTLSDTNQPAEPLAENSTSF